MAYQNINQYNFKKWYLLDRSEIQDFCLASDERDYKEEVIFSTDFIGADDGNLLPFKFDLNSPENSELFVLTYNVYNGQNNLISSNYYNPNNEDLSCYGKENICDIGLTGIDNGLVDQMTGETIQITKGLLSDSEKFDRLKFDRRLKLHQVTGHTIFPNTRFSGSSQSVSYNIVSKNDTNIGIYHELYGGFYQGFYKLFGYNYDIFPSRFNKGWSVEILLKPRFTDEFDLSGQTKLNWIYPENKDIFFYFGTRAENKFYHHASGSPVNYSGYTRVTENLDCLQTCACCNFRDQISRCIYVYPPYSTNGVHDPHQNYGCEVCGTNSSNNLSVESPCTCNCTTYPNCGWECQTHDCPNYIEPTTTTTTSECTCGTCTSCQTCSTCDGTKWVSVENTCEKDPALDVMSNVISLKLCGDPHNPKIGVRMIKFVEDCVTSGSCETSGVTHQTGYTIVDFCTPNGVYDYCENINPNYTQLEHWFQVNAVWERYSYFDKCHLWYNGGLGLITKYELLDSLANDATKTIAPPYTNGCKPLEEIELVQLNQNWLDEKDYRKGKLKIYVNGKIFHTFEDVEEIIPRALDTDKEKQVGVPFNISWGGGSQGLHDNLTFKECPESLTGLTYQQDPENLPNNILSATTLSGLNTNILIEQNFAGSFDGGISQFRMYTVPLSADEVKHNFLLLKDKFGMFNPDCPNCNTFVIPTTTLPTTTTTTINLTCDIQYLILPESIVVNNKILGRHVAIDSRDQKYLISSVFPQTTPIKITSKYWDDNIWWGNQGNTPMCVGYAWAHWIEDGPITHSGVRPVVSPVTIYRESQKIDEWYGENYDGTSVRAGAKYLKNTGKISSYLWAFDINTLINTILTVGPVVVGTNWYNGMFYPDRNGLIRISGRMAGGHAYVINGVDVNSRLFRIKNSWGQSWGKQGRAFISFNDMSRLIREQGEICLAIENKF